jgi:DnaK suppressor protein
MAEKRTVKKTATKSTKKTVKTPVRRPSVKIKPKAARKSKAVPKKPAARKSVVKKTTGKKKEKPVARRKTVSPQQRVAKKTSAKTAVPVKPPLRGKKAAQASEEERKAALRRSLIQKREEIVKEVKSEISKYIKGETRQLVDTALDDGDWSVVDLSEDISFKHMSTHRENLLKIDEALRKLSEGTYGICEDCGEEISQERLKILPFAIYCTDCQERKEQLEELEKREGLIG